MYKHDHTKHFANSTPVAVALCALAILGGRAAQAQQTATEITDPSQLGSVTSSNGPYTGPGFGQVMSPFSTSAGATSIVLTDQNGSVFTRQNDNAGGGLDFAVGTTLLQTADANNNDLGPLQIDFSTAGAPNVGVDGFGLQVQNFAFDQEEFTVQVFTNGSTTPNPLDTFTYGPFDNTTAANNGNGTAVFVGALSTLGNTITRAVISSTSFDQTGPDAFGNNFFFTPITITNVPAVPEASTVAGFGMGLVLFAGMAVGTRRRKTSRAPQNAA